MDFSSAKTQSTFELVDPGQYIGYCYRFVDKGTQLKRSAKFGDKMVRQVQIGFELTGTTREWEYEGQQRSAPYAVFQNANWSMHEKSNLRKFLADWRGRDFTPAELGAGGFKVESLIGTPARLQVVHSDCGQYANIKTIMSISKDEAFREVGAMRNDPLFFSLEPASFSEDALNKLGDKLQEAIRGTDEYARLTQVARTPAGPGGQAEELDDEVPW